MDFVIISLLWLCGYVATYAFTYNSIKKNLIEEKADSVFTAEFLMIMVGVAMSVLWPLEVLGRVIKIFRKEDQ